MAIDHFSRKVVCVAPLEGPNAGWIIDALEEAIRKDGAPKHLLSDQAPVFVGDAAVTEQVIQTLKYEWLKQVPIIKGFDHLMRLCHEFEHWYNAWRPHMTLDGLRPDDFYYSRKPEMPKPDAKTAPENIERQVFAETRLTAYRLNAA